MNLLKLMTSVMGGGKLTSPRTALNLINDEIEKKLKRSNERFDMSVDFIAEEITFSIPNTTIKEKINNELLFSLIRNYANSELKNENVTLFALVIEYDKRKAFPCRFYYIKENQQLFDTKTID